MTRPAPTPETQEGARERTGWFVAAGQIVGSVGEWETVYDWDGRTYPSRSRDRAISAGFGRFGSDDFNVGQVDAGRLVWWGWMDEEHPAEDRVEVAQSLGLATS